MRLVIYCFVILSVLRPSFVRAAESPTAFEILGNPKYPAICYGGYRETTRDVVPTVEQIKEDLKILSAMGIRIVRTYNTQQYAHAANLLEAIAQLNAEDSDFEMYVMLGAWIDCEGAWTDSPNHEAEDESNNRKEINAAVALAKKYPSIIKVIAVGNECMVHWAATYFVRPGVVLKWVSHLQQLKMDGKLSKDIWITSSDNFASWGGDGDSSYRTDDLKELIKAVDYVSMHTYPFHDSHYNDDYWVAPEAEAEMSTIERARAAMNRAVEYAKKQFRDTRGFVHSISPDKPIHIGETGWASRSNSLYGANGSQAADEFKAGLYFSSMRKWTDEAGISCFMFEAFDEPWKDAGNPDGSENHFGLININGEAKYPLWSLVDNKTFVSLTRGSKPVTKTFGGQFDSLEQAILPVPVAKAAGSGLTPTNEERSTGETVTENQLIVLSESLVPSETNGMTYPSAPVKLNVWDGTCGAEVKSSVVTVSPGAGAWWGCGLELQADGKGEDLSQFSRGTLHFEIRSETKSVFTVGFQTELWSKGNQTNNFATFNGTSGVKTSNEWQSHSLSIEMINNNAKLSDVTSLFYIRGDARADDRPIQIRNISWKK